MNRTRALVIKATSHGSTFAERHEAFGELVRLFQDMAFACACGALGDFGLAEDAAQEAFVTAWQKLGQLRRPEAFPGWLRRIVLTECSRVRRGQRLRFVPLEDGVEFASTGDDPQVAAESGELRRAMLAAVRSLPRRERVAVALFYAEGLSQKDAGEFLGVPVTTVAKRLHDARARLRSALTKDLTDGLERRRPSRDDSFADRVKAGIFDCYTGLYRYELRPDLLVTITRDGDRLFSEAAGQKNELFAHDRKGAALLAREFDGRGEFVKDAQGRITHFVYFEFGKEMGRASKIG